LRLILLGTPVYDGKRFQKSNGAFVAFRGSWNRDRPATNCVCSLRRFPQGYYEDFLTGFLLNPAEPTTGDQLAYSSCWLLLTEEANNRIYRIQYQG